MFCFRCGTPLPDDANVCSHCGTPTNDQTFVDPAVPATPPKKKSSAPLIIGLVAVFAAIVLIATIILSTVFGGSSNSVEPIVGNWTSSSYYDSEESSLQPLGKDGCLLDVEADGDFTFRIGSDSPETGHWNTYITDEGNTTYSFRTDEGALLLASMVEDPNLGCEMTLLVGDYLVLFNRK